MVQCPQKAGGLAWNINALHPMCQPLVSRARKAAAPAHSWTEITHGALSVHGAPSKDETTAAWFYVARGSGIYAYTGNTRVYADHGDAALDLLNKTCPFVESCKCTECIELFPELWAAAARRGYDSVQFTHHCDSKCSPNLCPTELVLVHSSSGGQACPTTFRRGWNASRSCDCVPGQPFSNCVGVTIPPCPAYAAFVVASAALAVAMLLTIACTRKAACAPNTHHKRGMVQLG